LLGIFRANPVDGKGSLDVLIAFVEELLDFPQQAGRRGT
jgi:hypothetical protein